MTWILKKEWEGKSIDTLNTPLDKLSQKQIESLTISVREALFNKKKAKKKDDTSN
jgi:hypothetical protein